MTEAEPDVPERIEALERGFPVSARERQHRFRPPDQRCRQGERAASRRLPHLADERLRLLLPPLRRGDGREHGERTWRQIVRAEIPRELDGLLRPGRRLVDVTVEDVDDRAHAERMRHDPGRFGARLFDSDGVEGARRVPVTEHHRGCGDPHLLAEDQRVLQAQQVDARHAPAVARVEDLVAAVECRAKQREPLGRRGRLELGRDRVGSGDSRRVATGGRGGDRGGGELDRHGRIGSGRCLGGLGQQVACAGGEPVQELALAPHQRELGTRRAVLDEWVGGIRQRGGAPRVTAEVRGHRGEHETPTLLGGRRRQVGCAAERGRSCAVPAARARPLRCSLELRGHVLVGAGGRGGPMPRPPVRFPRLLERVGERPVGSLPLDEARAAIGGAAHERMTEGDGVGRHVHESRRLRGLELGQARAEQLRRARDRRAVAHVVGRGEREQPSSGFGEQREPPLVVRVDRRPRKIPVVGQPVAGELDQHQRVPLCRRHHPVEARARRRGGREILGELFGLLPAEWRDP